MSVIKECKYTVEFDKIVNEIITNATIMYERRKYLRSYRALWDTGSTHTNVSKDVASKLGLKAVDKGTLDTPAGQIQCNIYKVDIILDSNVSINNVRVFESEIGSQDIDLLIGMDVIQRGEFIISNSEGKTKFSFSMPAKID